jgi:hypothetical protein
MAYTKSRHSKTHRSKTHRNKTRRSKTRRSKRVGGANNGMVKNNMLKNNGMEPPHPPSESIGGKRRSTKRKMSKGASEWHQQMMKVYKDMKKEDSSVKLGDAMKKAAEMKKKGLL